MRDASALTEIERSEVARRLGHDLYRFSRGDQRSDWHPNIVEGFEHAAARGVMRQTPNRHIRKWLQLRLGAFARNRAFDESVTPDMIMKIDVVECPILRVPLTHSTQLPTDWSVDRLNNDGAYAIHNLAVMSSQANEAKGSFSFDDVWRHAQLPHSTAGLEPMQWLRLASVMLGPCYVDRDGLIPTIPLAAPIPLHTARFPTQIIQQLFTMMSRRLSDKNVLLKHFKRACKTERSRDGLFQLCDALHFGLKEVTYPCDVWLDARVMQAFVAWHDWLDDREFAKATSIATAMAPVHQFSANRLQSWNLDSNGYRK
ncbi:MAG TPA: hypothetical protein VIF60_14985 [Burkholderiaceae bacterium]|jgi:hypothetical protein